MQVNSAAFSPKVTVVMPVYNVEPFIKQAVKSVLDQTFTDFELLIIDDQSPDNSISLVNEIAASDKRVRIIRQKNRGLAGARNTGISHAQGKYIAFLDSDDFWHQDKLQKHMALYAQQPNSGVTFSASMFVDEAGQVLNRIQTPYIKQNYTARNVFCRNPIGNGSAPVIRKSIFEQIAFKGRDKFGQKVDYWQYFDESLKQSEDIDCWTRIALVTNAEFSLIDEPLTFYRLNNAGLSADVEAQFQTWLQFIKKIETLAPEFVQKNGAAAKAFQCRYIARRCLSQAKGREALRWSFAAIKHSPTALLEECKRSIATFTASVVFACLPLAYQRRLMQLMI